MLRLNLVDFVIIGTYSLVSYMHCSDVFDLLTCLRIIVLLHVYFQEFLAHLLELLVLLADHGEAHALEAPDARAFLRFRDGSKLRLHF